MAYSCEPNVGGEHEVGWKVANSLNDMCNLTVITRTANKVAIEKCQDHNIDFIFVENRHFLRFKPKGKFSYLYYMFWQFTVYLRLKKLVKASDIVHYVTFGNIHLPNFLLLLKSNLVIGPMGGGSIINPRLINNPSFKIVVKSNIYKLLNASVKLNPFYYYYFHKCQKIILRTTETLNIIPNRFQHKCSVHLETGLDEFESLQQEKTRTLKKVITTGRMIQSKNIDQVVAVFKELSKQNKEPISLHVLGGGPLLETYKKQFSDETNVFFEGRIPHEKVNSFLESADLFLFCSIKEGGSHSLFEAAKYNLPIACYNISGMQEFPLDNSSIKITPTKDIKSNTKKLANKILEVFKKPEGVDKCCENAIADIQQNYFWKNHAQRYLKLYKDLK